VAALKVQAEQRRAGQLRECGVALRAMKDRGESVRDIARHGRHQREDRA
jgi:hypothetical protein